MPGNIKSIGEILIERNETLAVAESVTSGLLQYAIGSIEKASQFYQGGITVYNLGQKYKHLSVEPVHALKVNCVSEKVAGEMAVNVCNLFNSDWGISITGYASPVPESENKVFAFFATVFKQDIINITKLSTELTDPSKVQGFYIKKILEQFMAILNDQGS
jgi:nicotinamide-nucleotide amidase